MSVNIGLVLQARIDSNRLPGKVMYPFQNTTVLRTCFEIMKSVKLIDNAVQVIVATTSRKIDDVIVSEAKNCSILFYRGPKDDVLKRYYDCALKHKLDIIVRLTADNPFISPEVIEEAINILLGFQKLPTIVSTRNTYLPPGLDVECFNFEALEIAQKYSKSKYDKEHVTTFMYSDARVKLIKFETKKYSNMNFDENSAFTIDEPRDYINLAIYR